MILSERGYHCVMNELERDVVIVGGGLVGMSLAIALDASGLSVMQIEAQAPWVMPTPSNPQNQRWDQRNFVLARASLQALETMGVATQFDQACGAIESIVVTSRGDFGSVRFNATDYGLKQFGLCVPAHSLLNALETALANCRHVTRMYQTRLSEIYYPDENFICARIVENDITRTIRARLIVGADGAQSLVRELAKISKHETDYQQTAIVCTVQSQLDAKGVAFERLTSDGPVALLPLANQSMGCIFTVVATDAERVQKMPESEFLQQLQNRFGWQLGRFVRLGERQQWPLKLVHADQLISNRIVLVGNAAQSIHPIGAQGFNLGLRDACALAQSLCGLPTSTDCGAKSLLSEYALARQADRMASIQFSDGLVRLSQHQATPIRLLRSLGLGLIEHIEPLKREFAFSAMGYRAQVKNAQR